MSASEVAAVLLGLGCLLGGEADLGNCTASWTSAFTQPAAFGSKTMRRRVRVAWAKRLRALVDGRTFPPSIRAM